MDKDQRRALLKKHVQELGEHFDSVRIFATHTDDNHETAAMDDGRGNLYAQLGQIWEWLTIQEQYQRNWAIRQDQKDDSDE